MSFLSPPDVPNANDVSNQQQNYNKVAAQTQNQVNSYNQSNPYGTQTYTPNAASPSGYSLNTALSPELQKLFDTQLGTVGSLTDSSRGMYSSPYDMNAASGPTAGLLNKWQKDYRQPIFDQQQSNLDAQLQNQGLNINDKAYQNAQNLLARNQGDVTNQYLTMNQGQAFNQALQGYQLPLQTLSGLLGTVPGVPKFGATPTAQVQPPNYQQAAQNQFTGEQTQYQNMIGGLGQVAGLVAAPFTGGLSMLPGMFAGGSNQFGKGGTGGGWG